jgi:HEAT repeat protein
MTILLWIGGIIIALWLYTKISRWSRRQAQQRRARQEQRQARTNTLAMLSSPDGKVREKAIGRLEKTSDVARLVSIGKDDAAAEVRIAGYKRLRSWGETQATCELVDQCASSGQGDQIAEILREWWAEKNGPVVFDRGIHALIRMGGENGFAALLTFHGNKNLSEQLRNDMLTAFQRQPEVATAKAVEFLSVASNHSSRGGLSVVQLLGTLKQRSAVPCLRMVLESSDWKDITKAAIDSLAIIGGNEAVAAIAAALSHKEADVRRFACNGLGKLPVDSAAPLITKLLSESDETVRIAAVQALSQYGEAHISSLGEVFDRDSSMNVRFEAGVGLCQHGQMSARDTVFNELVRQTTLEQPTCTESAIKQACEFFRCPDEYALARLSLHIPITQRVCGHSSQPGGGAYYEDVLNSEASLKGLRELCLKNHPFATEILKVVAARQSITVRLCICLSGYDRNIDLSPWRQEARQELIRRGIQA